MTTIDTPTSIYLNARRKPIVGAIAAVLTYLALKVGFDLDSELSAGISATIFTFVVERVSNR